MAGMESQYGNELKEQLSRLTAALSSRSRHMYCLVVRSTLLAHLRSFMEDALGTLQDAVEFVILTQHPADLQSVAAEYGAVLLDMPLHQLCSGPPKRSATNTSHRARGVRTSVQFGGPLALKVQMWQWMEEELEFVHLSAGIGSSRPSPRGARVSAGAEIDWYELSLHVDIDGDKTVRLKHLVETALERKRAVRINLYPRIPEQEGRRWHVTSCGSFIGPTPAPYSTDARPLRRPSGCFAWHLFTGQAILLLVDGAQIADRQVDQTV